MNLILFVPSGSEKDTKLRLNTSSKVSPKCSNYKPPAVPLEDLNYLTYLILLKYNFNNNIKLAH